LDPGSGGIRIALARGLAPIEAQAAEGGVVSVTQPPAAIRQPPPWRLLFCCMVASFASVDPTSG
jgi:hypothetical protein